MRLGEFLETCSRQEIQALNRRLGMHRYYLSRVSRGERRPSHATALVIEKITKGMVPRWELRPDIWEKPASLRANGSKPQRKARAIA